MCDEDRNAACPHRGWSREVRDQILDVRSHWLEACPECDKRHEYLRDTLQCQADGVVERVRLTAMGHQAKGCVEPLLPDRFPSFIKERAWRKVRSMVIERDGGCCHECGRDLSRFPPWYTEVHHIVPVISGGSDHPGNLMTLCTECHGAHTDQLFKGPLEKHDGKGNSSRNRIKGSYTQRCLHELEND
jgi:hypothetical protein